MAQKQSATLRVFICRASLVLAFVLAFAAVIFNINLVTQGMQALKMSTANAAPTSLQQTFGSEIDGVLLMVAIATLVLISLLSGGKRPQPPKSRL